jgi:hypothetical protein
VLNNQSTPLIAGGVFYCKSCRLIYLLQEAISKTGFWFTATLIHAIATTDRRGNKAEGAFTCSVFTCLLSVGFSAGFDGGNDAIHGNRRYLKNRIWVQGQGEIEWQPADILKYFEELDRGPNAEMGIKDIFEMPSNNYLCVSGGLARRPAAG